MGQFENQAGTRRFLRARHQVGRSRNNALRLKHPSISGEHAILLWDGPEWVARDLASRNCTWVDDDTIPEGDSWPLSVGCTVEFGLSDDLYALVDDGPPQRMIGQSASNVHTRIHRVRKHLTTVGIGDAARIVERRPHSGGHRVGPHREDRLDRCSHPPAHDVKPTESPCSGRQKDDQQI